jgi:hypothetical protein
MRSFSFSKKVIVRSDNTLSAISGLLFCFTIFSCVSSGSWSRICPEFFLHPQIIRKVEKTFNREKHKIQEINLLISCPFKNLHKTGQSKVKTPYSLFQSCSSALRFFRVFRVVRGPVFALDLFFTRNSLGKLKNHSTTNTRN